MTNDIMLIVISFLLLSEIVPWTSNYLG